jgi:hypothetical protein
METQKFYVVHVTSKYGDAANVAYVSTRPLRGAFCQDIIEGKINDGYVAAHGAFGTQEEAEAFIKAEFRDYGEGILSDEWPHIVAWYESLPVSLDAYETRNYIRDSLRGGAYKLFYDSSDDDIENMLMDMDNYLYLNYYSTLDWEAALDYLTVYRARLQEEAENEEEE